MKTCPLCSHPVTATQIMCYPHWDRVPPELKEPIRKNKSDRTSPAYIAGVKAVVNYLRGKDLDHLDQTEES